MKGRTNLIESIRVIGFGAAKNEHMDPSKVGLNPQPHSYSIRQASTHPRLPFVETLAKCSAAQWVVAVAG